MKANSENRPKCKKKKMFAIFLLDETKKRKSDQALEMTYMYHHHLKFSINSKE